jgi:hypothetical protein
MSDASKIHHTATQRWITVGSYIVIATAPYAILAAIALDAATVDDDGVHLESWVSTLLGVALLLACPGFAIGWLTWATNAARNARMVTPLAMSPFTPIIGVALMVVVIVVPQRYTEPDATLNLLCVATAVVIHLFVINSFRGTSARLGAPTVPWAHLIWMPFVVAGATVAVSMASVAMTPTTANVLAVTVSGLGSLAIGVAMHRGMGSFDRAAEVRSHPHVDPMSMAARLFSAQPD